MGRFVFALFIFAGLAPATFAQPWMIPPQGGTPPNDALGVIAAFDAYTAAVDAHPSTIPGYKQVERMRWFVMSRLQPDGRYLPAAHFAAAEAYARQFPEDSQLATDAWQPRGPFFPIYNSNTGGMGRTNCLGFDPTNPNHFYAGTASGGLWETWSGGYDWTPLTDHLPVLGVADLVVHPDDPDIIYMATGDADAFDTPSVGVLKSVDGGGTWQATGLTFDVTQVVKLTRLVMHPNDPNILLAAGTNNIWRTEDGGDTWNVVATGPLTWHDLIVHPDNPSVWLAGMDGQGIYRSTDGGNTFFYSQVGIPSAGPSNWWRVTIDIAPSDPNVVYVHLGAVGSFYYGTYRSNDAGASYTLTSNTPNLAGPSYFGTDTGGQAWYDFDVLVDLDDPDVLYSAAVNIWKSEDGGVTWSIYSFLNTGYDAPFTHADHHRLYWHNNNMLTCTDGGVFSTPNGQYWNYLQNGFVANQIYRLGIAQSDPAVSQALIGTQDSGTKRLTPDDEWVIAYGNDGMEAAIDPTDPTYMYVCWQFGNLMRSPDHGQNFYPINTIPQNEGGWVTPYVIDPNDPTVIWYGSDEIWKSTNRAQTFSVSSPSTGTQSTDKMVAVDVAPSNSDYVYGVNYSGDVLATYDGGDSWLSLLAPGIPGTTLPTYLTVAPDDPQRVYITLGGYTPGQKLYRSDDGGLSWISLSDDLPNLPINCVEVNPLEPDHIYVGTDVGVLFSDDGGQSWVDYSYGLPNVVVTELEIHEPSNTLVAATYGRGMWDSPAMAVDGELPDVQLTLTPVVDTLPAAGGTVLYDVALASQLGSVVPGVSYWVEVETPNGQTIGPITLATFTHQPFMNVTVPGVSLTVPASAPLGEYELIGRVGYPNLYVEDSFPFTKLGQGASLSGWVEWSADGFDIAGAVDGLMATAPDAFRLAPVAPNPFNPTARVSVALPTAAELTVTVHDITGRQVAELARGLFSAGEQRFTFDGTAHASGVYFVRAVVPGHMDQQQKMVLMK